jgi:type VI secretion system protein VasD
MSVRRLTSIPVLLMILGWTACAAPPSQEPTAAAAAANEASVSLLAAADLNPDSQGRPGQVLVRVYFLKSAGIFQAAEFFDLLDSDEATLGTEFIARREFILFPGSERRWNWQTEPDAKVVAAMAAFRDIDGANWRVATELPAGIPIEVTARLSGNSIDLSAKGAP